MKHNTRGFTLIELLVVIGIIGLLAVVALASMDQARKNARDKARIADLEQIKAGLHIYAVSKGTYKLDAGSQNGGTGWFSYVNGSNYQKSMADEMVTLGLLTINVHDPLVPANTKVSGTQHQYMVYFPTDGPTKGVCVFAQLERPSSDQQATIDNTRVAGTTINSLKSSTYSMNYATCIP